MPMASDDESLWIVYNGEAYNFEHVRNELKKEGRSFRSDCDTEVVLRAYEHWGEDCPEHLSGMFAFAIWDRRRERLFAARDRLGVKPLFFRVDGGRFEFASEAHALMLGAKLGPEDVDRGALDAYLAWGYVPAGQAFVKGLSKLPPAHRLVFDRSGVRMQRYWRPRFRPTQSVDLEQALDGVEERLGNAVESRLRSDVPFGCFLSGGIDSGLVVALAASRASTRLKTFSVSFSGALPEEDETSLAAKVAERFDTEHTTLEISPDQKRMLPQAIYHVAEPYADVGILPMSAISSAAREHITVALSGDGGDESFAGYANVLSASRAEKFRKRVPPDLRRLAGRLVSHEAITKRIPRLASADRWLRNYVERPASNQFDYGHLWNWEMRNELYGPTVPTPRVDAASVLIADLLSESDDLCDAEKHLLVDLNLRLPADYLVKVDIASNMHSLEVRSPFLDYELVEYAASLPFELKLLDGKQKGLLRRLAERHLPHEVVNAPKRGFAPKMSEWLRGDWRGLVSDLITDSRLVSAGFFDPSMLKRVVDEHQQGRSDHTHRIWSVIGLEIWWRLFIEKSLSPTDEL